MLLKTLLHNVVRWIEHHPVDTGALIVKIEASHAHKTVEGFILAMDIRHLGTLRALVPMAFPRKLRKGEITIHQNSIGAWRVDPKETVDVQR